MLVDQSDSDRMSESRIHDSRYRPDGHLQPADHRTCTTDESALICRCHCVPPRNEGTKGTQVTLGIVPGCIQNVLLQRQDSMPLWQGDRSFRFVNHRRLVEHSKSCRLPPFRIDLPVNVTVAQRIASSDQHSKISGAQKHSAAPNRWECPTDVSAC